MNLYINQFSDSCNFPDSGRPCKFLIIASTARSGSHMLGHALYETAKFGFPLEYFNPANLKKWESILGSKGVDDTLERLFRIRTSGNGVFSVKIHYSQLSTIGGFRHLQRLFPNAYYVFLKRDDLVNQAVSYAVALQTGVWINGQEPVDEKLPKYSFDLIKNCLEQIVIDNARWIYSFQSHGIAYKEIEFSKSKNFLKDVLLEIADYSKINLRPTEVDLDHKTLVQSNSLNRSWVDQYLEDVKNSNFSHYPR